MRSIPVVSLVAALAASSFACGDDGGGGELSFAEFPSAFARASCAKIFECCDAAERSDQLSLFNPEPMTVDECTTALGGLLSVAFGDTEPFDAGRLEYDGDAAAACIAAMNATSCTGGLGEAPPACEDFFVGRVAAGGQCMSADECAAADSFCADQTGDEFGTCTALPAIGQPCEFDCVDGAYCEFMTSTCAAQKANGTTCDFDSECLSNNCDTTCAAEPIVCDGA